MKIIFTITVLIFLSGCTNNNSNIKRLKSNHKLYEKLGNYSAVITKNATVYIEQLSAKKNKSFKILINSRDREKDIHLNRCRIDKKEAVVIPIYDNSPFNIDWLKTYKANSVFASNKKETVLECELSSGDKFSKVLFQ